MKWTRPEQGTERTRTSFLFFPKEIDGETRWLQKATWLERVSYYGWDTIRWDWSPVRWADKDAA